MRQVTQQEVTGMTIVGPAKVSRPNEARWASLTRHIGIALLILGLITALWSDRADWAWGAFLIVVGVVAQRVAPSTSLALFSATFTWAGLVNILFGRLAWAVGLFVVAGLALTVCYAAYRSTTRPLPPTPRLAWASLIFASIGTMTLNIALGAGVVAWLTGWAYDARLADVLAAAGAHQAVLGLCLGIGALLQPSRQRWTAILGGLTGLLAASAYLSLLVLAQG